MYPSPRSESGIRKPLQQAACVSIYSTRSFTPRAGKDRLYGEKVDVETLTAAFRVLPEASALGSSQKARLRERLEASINKKTIL
jgi:hypothetical protein